MSTRDSAPRKNEAGLVCLISSKTTGSQEHAAQWVHLPEPPWLEVSEEVIRRFAEEAIERVARSRAETADALQKRQRGVWMVLANSLRMIRCSSTFLGLADVRHLARDLERVVRKLTVGACPWNEASGDLVLEGLQTLQEMLACWRDGTDGLVDGTELRQRLAALVVSAPVLVISADEERLDSLAGEIEERGLRCFRQMHVIEAFFTIGSEPLLAVVLDCPLPRSEDGIELCRAIYRMAPETRVFLLVPAADRHGLMTAHAAGVAAVFDRDLQQDDLVELLASLDEILH